MMKCKIVGCAVETAALSGLCIEHEAIVFYLVHGKGFSAEETTILYKRQLERIRDRKHFDFFLQEIELEIENDHDLMRKVV